MSEISKKIVIVPCSGIGKSYGTVSRLAAYQVTEEDNPEKTQLVPLALLVMGNSCIHTWRDTFFDNFTNINTCRCTAEIKGWDRELFMLSVCDGNQY